MKWALTPPTTFTNLYFGIKNTEMNSMIGFITGIPSHIKIEKKDVVALEVNFLCVHKKDRNKKIGPILISEITRRANE